MDAEMKLKKKSLSIRFHFVGHLLNVISGCAERRNYAERRKMAGIY
jgi:hypothetical protein